MPPQKKAKTKTAPTGNVRVEYMENEVLGPALGMRHQHHEEESACELTHIQR